MALPSSPFAVTSEELPTSRSDRLIFYTEVLVANTPLLISDLSSAKYTFLRFSERTRTEVKQKSTLLQSISRTFSNLVNAYKNLVSKSKELRKLEDELVTAAPPRFVSSVQESVLSSNSYGAAAAAQASSSARQLSDVPSISSSGTGGGGDGGGSTMVLAPEDLAAVRAAEEELQCKTETVARLAAEVQEFERTSEVARTECQRMTSRVQKLKWEYESVLAARQHVRQRRAILTLLCEEYLSRREIVSDAGANFKELQNACRTAELSIIHAYIDSAKEDAQSAAAQLKARREEHELELATYQIAYKEEQAAVEAARDDITFLRAHQRKLERLAKQQQAEETNRNSLRKLLLSAIRSSPSKRGQDGALTARQEQELEQDHLLVSVLAAQVSEMDSQRQIVAGIMAQGSKDSVGGDIATIRSIMLRVQSVLRPELVLNSDALGDNAQD